MGEPVIAAVHGEQEETRWLRRRGDENNALFAEGSRNVATDSVWRNSDAFRTAFGVFLGLVVFVRLIIFALIVWNRKHPSLQLAQPFVLGVLVLAGAAVCGSCFLLMPLNDTYCLLREPLILTPMTMCGNILAGRVWRVNILMTPVLQMNKREKRAQVKKRILMAFSALANADVRCCFRPGEGAKLRKSALRQKVTLAQLLQLVCILTLPQLAMQSLNLFVPELQEKHTVEEVDAPVPIERETCEAGVSSWSTWLGIAIMAIPYLLTGALSLHAEDLPKIFNEAKALISSFRVMAVVGVVAGPAFAVAESPDASSFLLASMVLITVMGPVWFVVYPKLWALTKASNGQQRVTRMLLRRSPSVHEGLNPQQIGAGGADHEKSAKLALTIGKMYEDMGLVQKSIILFDEALAVWQCDPARDHKEQIGGFTLDEISAFSATDLEYIIQLLIAKGRVNGTFNSARETGQKNAAQAWLDALEIYERSPASVDMRDRSIIFPIFSGLFVFLKGGKITQDKDCNFEQNLVRKFVKETKLHGDPVHYSRALAMQCEVKARLGKYTQALSSFETLQSIYDPDCHSEGVALAYGTDRSAQAFSQSALWHMQLGDIDKALEACDYVIRFLLPVMDPKNVLNMCELILPVIRVQKPRGEALAMLRLFEEHVVENFNTHFGKDGVTPCLPIFKPLTMLLRMCEDPENFPNITDAVEWLVEEQNGVPPDFLDSVYTKLCWSPNSMVAELCLLVSKYLWKHDGSIEDLGVILKKGVRLARKADVKMKDSQGQVNLPIAYSIHQPVALELETMAAHLGYEIETDECEKSACGDVPGVTNLPSSYMKTKNNSSDSSSPGSSSRTLAPSPTVNYTSTNSSESGSGPMFPLRKPPSNSPVPARIEEQRQSKAIASVFVSDISIPLLEEGDEASVEEVEPFMQDAAETEKAA